MAGVGVVVLAAGQSSRFSGGGEHKLLAHLNGVPVVRLAVTAAVDAAAGPVVVVTGAQATAVAAALDGLNVEIAHAPSFADGMSASLRRGVDVCRETDAIVVALGDQPGLRPEAIRRVVSRWRETGAAIVVPRYDSGDRPAHPVLFTSPVYDELRTLEGDVGARSVIQRDPGRVAFAALDWAAPRDIDTPADLRSAAEDLAITRMPEPTPNFRASS